MSTASAAIVVVTAVIGAGTIVLAEINGRFVLTRWERRSAEPVGLRRLEQPDVRHREAALGAGLRRV
jgi:hypothetical protein